MSSGSRTLKDALNEALRDWVSNPLDTFYVIGTVAGPHPYPAMVRDFQSIIGTEAKAQLHWRRKAGCRTCWWRPWAAAPTPWACSIPSSTTARCGSSRSRPPATASPRASTRRR